MAERERLIELLDTYNPRLKSENIADYLLKNGVVVLPCKVGSTVYLLRNGFIEPCNVEGIHFTSRKNYVRLRPFQQAYIGNWSTYYTPSIQSFGKTVFCSINEAEKALERSKNNE